MDTKALAVQFENIPMELKRIPRWVLWKFVEVGDEGRVAKLPMQIGGKPASSSNPQTWKDFITIQDAYQNGNYDGIGFVFDGSDIMGIDIDDCRSPDGTLSDFAKEILENVEGYAEVSPSGTGLKIFTRAEIDKAHVDHSIGLEIYNKGRYFTVTGHVLDSTRNIPNAPQDLSKYVTKRAVATQDDSFANLLTPVDDYDLNRVETEILSQLISECGYDDWLRVGMALYHQFNGDIEACEAWDRWSSNDGNSASYTPGLCDRKWASFRIGETNVTLRSLIFKTKQQAMEQALSEGKTIVDTTPLAQAKLILDHHYLTPDGYALVHHASDFYEYTGTHYDILEEATIRSKTYLLLGKCYKPSKNGVAPLAPTPSMVNGALDAVSAITHLPVSSGSTPPIWLEDYRDRMPDAHKLVSLKNGLYHIEQDVLLPHSLGFFTPNSLQFDYDPNATCPKWETFLSQVFENDPESINTLQEWFAYILTGDSKQQKFMSIVGPRRSGKGTINKILVALLGQHNTVAPQLEELTDTFGLQSWLNKPLAAFTDVRMPERNRTGVVSQLLRIVGGDAVTVNRKNKESWSGYLPTRIIMYSNEPLQLNESSNALTGRMLCIQMSNSFYGRENVNLYDELMTELSGIFNWAIVGNKRRMQRSNHRFVQPQTGLELLQAIETIGNPLIEFIEEYIEFVPDEKVLKLDLFNLWRKYAGQIGATAGQLPTFSRKFIGATQDHKIIEFRPQGDGNRPRYFKNIKLNAKGQKYVDDLQFGDI